ncbi:MAG: hydantoinase/oxoprolinase family protein [Nitrospiraceae bacterium]
MSEAAGAFRIGVDIGGTFTDMVLVSDGDIRVVKVPTVPSDPAQGVINALEKAASVVKRSMGELLQACEVFVHGSTVATNTILEGKGARVGLLTSEGFRDALEIRRGIRESAWAHRKPYAPVLVPRYLRQAIPIRIERDGSVTTSLSKEGIQQAAKAFKGSEIESLAICLYNGYLNSEEERSVAEAIREAGVAAPVSLSSAIAPIAGEYERTSTVVMNAYIGPKTTTYLSDLAVRLKELGLRPSVMLVQSNAGAISVEEIASRPVTLLLSGPASGVGALRYYQAAIGSENLISMEIGGTSCDVVLVDKGEVRITDQLDIGGYRVMIPSVEVHTIGAGGGTIARVDPAGMLHVGPEGAGARPGPACFGFGGTDATITDAHVVLGRLQAGPYAGGSIVIDLTRAQKAIQDNVATPLGISCEDAAAGIIRLMEQKLLGAVQRLSVERGYDPRHFTLIAAGGAGPMHGASVARLLGCPQVYVPRVSGAFCALGMLNVDARHDFVKTFIHPLADVTEGMMTQAFEELSAQAIETLQREGFKREEIRIERGLSLQYPGQQADIPVVLDTTDTFDKASIREMFETLHQQFFGHIQPAGSPLITKLRLAGLGLLPRLPTKSLSADGHTPAARESRRIWLDATHGWCSTPIYSGTDLTPGASIHGPAVIDESTTTIIVGAGERVTVDAENNYLISLPATETKQ